MITFLSASISNAIGGDWMKLSNKSIAKAMLSCRASKDSKESHNVFGIINGTSATEIVSEPEGRFCPFDR